MRAATNTLTATQACPKGLRAFALRCSGVAIGASTSINAHCFFGGASDIAIGENSFLNHGVWFAAAAPITIGRNVMVGHRAAFLASTHEMGPAERRAGQSVGRSIEIGDGCWIGAGALVLPGVTVGPGCIVAAGAVVTEDCTSNGVYAGVPARRVKELHA